MNRLLFLLLCVAFLVSAKGQNNYAEAIKQGDAAFKKEQYKLAIDKYFAAEAFDPTKKDIVRQKVKLTFDKIESLRKEEIKSRRMADSALKIAQRQEQNAQRQEQIALNALDEAKKQKKEAERLKEVAEKQTRLADSSLKNFQELKKTVIGTRYQGGIVISWEDSTGKHGVIAAVKDLGKYTWKEAKEVCENLILEGYSDWHLPNRTELAILYANRNVVGGFEESYYWSSTDAGIFQIKAWSQIFTTGFQTGRGKDNKYLVRPVRAF